jgi:hypothetical protein
VEAELAQCPCDESSRRKLTLQAGMLARSGAPVDDFAIGVDLLAQPFGPVGGEGGLLE